MFFCFMHCFIFIEDVILKDEKLVKITCIDSDYILPENNLKATQKMLIHKLMNRKTDT